MGTSDISSISTKPSEVMVTGSEAMVTENDNKSAKSLKIAVSTQGLALNMSEAEGNICYGKELDSMRKFHASSENVEFVDNKLGENGKTAPDSGNDNTFKSAIEDSTDGNDDKAHRNEFSAMKRCSNQMLADENNGASHCRGADLQVSNLGDHLVSMPAPSLNMGMRSNESAGGSKSLIVRLNAPSVSVLSTTMAGREEFMSEQRIQDERELKKEMKRHSNKISARKSRIHKQQINQFLQARVELLSNETSKLSCALKKHSKYCVKLKRENKSLLEELKRICNPDTISILEAKNPDRAIQSVDGESKSYTPESPSKYNSNPDQSIDT